MARSQSPLAGVAAILASLCAAAGAARAQTAEDSRTLGFDYSSEILVELDHGNRAFAKGGARKQDPFDEGARRSLEHGIRPRAIVLSCADSRLVPETIFQAAIGELYVIRVPGGVCDEAALASLEFAVSRYGIGTCVALGNATSDLLPHAGPTLRTSPAGERLLERFAPALRLANREASGDSQKHTAETRLRVAAEETVYHSIHEAVRRSRLLRGLTEEGELRFQPAVYDNKSGLVRWLRPRAHDAVSIDEKGDAKHRVQRVRGMPPHVVARTLHAGHKRFLSRGSTSGDTSPERRASLAEGQRPVAVVIAEADPRVAPERIFDVGLGDLFVIRVAGHQITDELIAAVEHAVDRTGASIVVALTQDRSDAMQYAIDQHGNPPSQSVSAMLDWLAPSIQEATNEGLHGDALARRASEFTAQRVIQELRTSHTLHEIEHEGFVAFLPALYEVGSGDLWWLKTDEVGAHGHGAAPHGEHGHAKASSGGHVSHGDPGAHTDHDTHGHEPSSSHAPHTAHDEHGASGAHGHDHGLGHGNNHGHDHGLDHGNNHGNDHGNDHGHDHGLDDHGRDHGNDHGRDHGNDHGLDDHGRDHGHDHGLDDHGRDHGHDHGLDDHGRDHGHAHTPNLKHKPKPSNGMAPVFLAAICAAIGGIAIVLLGSRRRPRPISAAAETFKDPE